jgi:hypothetical protein
MARALRLTERIPVQIWGPRGAAFFLTSLPLSMSPESRTAFALRSAAVGNALHGTVVRFRGQDIRVNLAPVALSLDLDSGGLRQSGEFSIRFLASDLQSPPRRDESVVYGGRTYLLNEPQQNSPVGQYLSTMRPGSRQ